MPKLDDAITYEIFKILAKDPNSTQRALAKSLEVNLGKANYCLKALIAKGWIKAKNFEQSILSPAAGTKTWSDPLFVH